MYLLQYIYKQVKTEFVHVYIVFLQEPSVWRHIQQGTSVQRVNISACNKNAKFAIIKGSINFPGLQYYQTCP